MPNASNTHHSPRLTRPGPIALFGSGETAPAGRRVHAHLFHRLDGPPRVAVLETPAGFQPNSAWVAGRLVEFIRERLQNFAPQVTQVPARRRDGPYSSDDSQLNAPILSANYIFAGPGSPTYAVHHLQDTWAWHAIVARQRRGAVLALASATAIAVGSHVLPVYEVYKAGADLHWVPGLDLLRPYGLELAVVTHWNNQEGGEHLDTCCGFMGAARMTALETMLPPTATLLGIDEHTALLLDLAEERAQVMGNGGVTVRREGQTWTFTDGQHFPLQVLGAFHPLNAGDWSAGLPASVVQAVLAAEAPQGPEETEDVLPPEVAALIEQREAARRVRDWPGADACRAQLERLGYAIDDTPEGPRWRRLA